MHGRALGAMSALACAPVRLEGQALPAPARGQRCPRDPCWEQSEGLGVWVWSGVSVVTQQCLTKQFLLYIILQRQLCSQHLLKYQITKIQLHKTGDLSVEVPERPDLLSPVALAAA